jgi:hypothetical protein
MDTDVLIDNIYTAEFQLRGNFMTNTPDLVLKKNHRQKSQGYLRIQKRGRKEPKKQYGIWCRSYWENGRKQSDEIWLGKVINENERIFTNRKRGVFRFTPPDVYETLPEPQATYHELLHDEPQNSPDSDERPKLIVFGASHAVEQSLRQSGLLDLFARSFGHLGDSVLALVLFKITNGGAYKYVNTWLQNTYAHYLFPRLHLPSQRVSEVLAKISSQHLWQHFFENYTDYINKMAGGIALLIDSTGLPNDINTDLTQRNNHNGVISNEIRMIVAIEQITGYPLYFKYVPGNVVDKVTLTHVLDDLMAFNIDISAVILDAGYYSEENMKFLHKRRIGFITRLIANKSEYKQLRDEHSTDLTDPEYLVHCNGRALFVKKIQIEIDGMPFYAYACIDIKERFIQQERLYREYDKKKDKEAQKEKIRTAGFFVILSLNDILTDDILITYYKREVIQQIFDYAKTDLDLVPVACHNEDTIRGHLMLCFMAAVGHTYLTHKLKKSNFCVTSILEELVKYCASVRPDGIYPDVVRPIVRKIYTALNLPAPVKLDLDLHSLKTER